MPEPKTMVTETPVRLELLEASDEQIEQAVEYAEPLVLRGLLYQLTGDENLVSLEVMPAPRKPGSPSFALVNSDDVTMVRRKAADFLKTYRDRGAGPIDIGPVERLPRSLALVAGVDLPDDDHELWLEELA